MILFHTSLVFYELLLSAAYCIFPQKCNNSFHTFLSPPSRPTLSQQQQSTMKIVQKINQRLQSLTQNKNKPLPQKAKFQAQKSGNLQKPSQATTQQTNQQKLNKPTQPTTTTVQPKTSQAASQPNQVKPSGASVAEEQKKKAARAKRFASAGAVTGVGTVKTGTGENTVKTDGDSGTGGTNIVIKTGPKKTPVKRLSSGQLVFFLF